MEVPGVGQWLWRSFLRCPLFTSGPHPSSFCLRQPPHCKYTVECQKTQPRHQHSSTLSVCCLLLAQMRPPVTAVMARLLLNEPLGPAGALGCAISVAGVTVLAHPPFLFGGHSDWSQKRLVGTLCGVASTLFASGTSYAIRRCAAVSLRRRPG